MQDTDYEAWFDALTVGDKNKMLKIYDGKNVDIDMPGPDLDTALHYAGLYNHTDIASWLVTHRAIGTVNNAAGYTALTQTVHINNVDVLKVLVDYFGSDINIKNSWGTAASHVAIVSNVIDALEVLLDQPALELNSQDTIGRTPLTLAIEYNRVDQVKLILNKRGYDIDHQLLRNGKTALEFAKANNVEIAKLLQDYVQTKCYFP